MSFNFEPYTITHNSVRKTIWVNQNISEIPDLEEINLIDWLATAYRQYLQPTSGVSWTHMMRLGYASSPDPTDADEIFWLISAKAYANVPSQGASSANSYYSKSNAWDLNESDSSWQTLFTTYSDNNYTIWADNAHAACTSETNLGYMLENDTSVPNYYTCFSAFSLTNNNTNLTLTRSEIVAKMNQGYQYLCLWSNLPVTDDPDPTQTSYIDLDELNQYGFGFLAQQQSFNNSVKYNNDESRWKNIKYAKVNVNGDWKPVKKIQVKTNNGWQNIATQATLAPF